MWSCSGCGLPSRPVTWPLVSSYLTISPLLLIQRAVCFCGTFRRVTPPGRYPAPCPVELGLSSLISMNQSGHPVYLADIHFTPWSGSSQIYAFWLANFCSAALARAWASLLPSCPTWTMDSLVNFLHSSTASLCRGKRKRFLTL